MMRKDQRGNDPAQGHDGHWPDAVFRVALVVWMVLGLTSILKALLLERPSVASVVLVAWGVIVIFVLWFRLGPPRDTTDPGRVLR